MKRPNDIKREELAMTTLVELTGAFESLASMRIAQIKNQVLQATEFFKQLWYIYSQLRVNPDFGFGRRQEAGQVNNKELYILITAEGGFSGDIDQKLIKLMMQTYQADKNDIIVIGHHGALQLAQRGVSYKKYFKLPVRDQNINVAPIINEIQTYRSTVVFYQEYVTLMVQDVKRIELINVVQQQGRKAAAKEDVISEANYIFEPSTYDLVDHLERSMLYIAVSQLILDSKLAQYASRFRAMTASHQRADEAESDLRLSFNRSRRALKDERLKEVINGLKNKHSKVGL